MSTSGSSGGGGTTSTASSGRVTTGSREPEWRGTRSTPAIFTDASGAIVRCSGDAAEQAVERRTESKARPRPRRREVRHVPVGDDVRIARVARPDENALAEQPTRAGAAALGNDGRK